MKNQQLVVGICGGPYANYEALASCFARFDPIIVYVDRAVREALSLPGVPLPEQMCKQDEFERTGKIDTFFHDSAIFTNSLIQRLQSGRHPLIVMGFTLFIEDARMFRLRHPGWRLQVLIPPVCQHKLTLAEKDPNERVRMARYIEWKTGGREKFFSSLEGVGVSVFPVDNVHEGTVEILLGRILADYGSAATV
jgi:hypothetical protein